MSTALATCDTARISRTLDLIIDLCLVESWSAINCFGGGGFSTERVPRAASVVRSVASMTLNECLQARKRPWSRSNCVYTRVYGMAIQLMHT